MCAQSHHCKIACETTTIINVDHDSASNDCSLLINSNTPKTTQKDYERSAVYENKGVILSEDCEATYNRSLAVRSSIITNSTVLINIRLQVENKEEANDNN